MTSCKKYCFKFVKHILINSVLIIISMIKIVKRRDVMFCLRGNFYDMSCGILSATPIVSFSLLCHLEILRRYTVKLSPCLFVGACLLASRSLIC